VKRNTYPDRGIRGLVPSFPEPLDGFCNGPSVEPPLGLELLGAWADEASGILCADEAIWPRVLTPDDGALVSGDDVIGPPANEVRGDRTHGRGATNINGGTPGAADPLSKGPSRAFPPAGSSSPSMGTEAALDT
jgi:hypothetical protein